MKFLRKVFTNGLIGLIFTWLAVFGVGMGLISWHDGQLLWAILYAAVGAGIFIVGRIIAGNGDDADEGPSWRDRWHF